MTLLIFRPQIYAKAILVLISLDSAGLSPLTLTCIAEGAEAADLLFFLLSLSFGLPTY